MTLISLSAESNKTVGIILISLFALITLAAFTALAYSIMQQRRNDKATLPEIDGFGGVDSSKEESSDSQDEPSVFYLEEEETPLPGLGDGEGEDFLRETRKAQKKNTKPARAFSLGRGKK